MTIMLFWKKLQKNAPMEVDSMTELKAKFSREDNKYIHLKIKKSDFEAFCSAAGLFRKSFLKTLRQSEKDLKQGRYTVRESLQDLSVK
jgi:hypothetical protein